jgi:hypothetical protein
MEREVHLEFLKQKYIQLSRQYLTGLHEGRTVEQLKDLADLIRVLISEIEILERDINTG